MEISNYPKQTFLSKEHDCELVYAVVIPSYGKPNDLRYKIARRMDKILKLSFDKHAEVHIGTRNGNLVSWSEDDEVWPKGEAV